MMFLFIGVIFCSVMDLTWNYVNPETEQRLDPIASLYAVLALLAFESAIPFPDSWITRLVFFTIPLFGLLILGQGLIRLGSALLNIDLWNKAMASTYTDHTIVCGLGKVSLKVTRWVLDLNEEAVVIENDANNVYLKEVRSWGVPVIIDDARRPEVLEHAGIRNAESIVPCTNDDLTNLTIALEARRMEPHIKVVLRMFDLQMAANIKSAFDIHTVFSIPDISAPAFAAAATKAPLDQAFAFGEGKQRNLITITEFTLVPESILSGYTVGQLEEEFGVAIIAHRSDEDFHLHPVDSVPLAAEDRIVVSASIEALNKLASLTPPTRELEHYYQGHWSIRTR